MTIRKRSPNENPQKKTNKVFELTSTCLRSVVDTFSAILYVHEPQTKWVEVFFSFLVPHSFTPFSVSFSPPSGRSLHRDGGRAGRPAQVGHPLRGQRGLQAELQHGPARVQDGATRRVVLKVTREGGEEGRGEGTGESGG